MTRRCDAACSRAQRETWPCGHKVHERRRRERLGVLTAPPRALAPSLHPRQRLAELLGHGEPALAPVRTLRETTRQWHLYKGADADNAGMTIMLISLPICSEMTNFAPLDTAREGIFTLLLMLESTRRISRVTALIACTFFACSGSENASTSTAGSDGNSSGSSSAPEISNDVDVTTSAGGSDTEDSGTSAIDLGPCGRLTECIETLDESITAYLAVYGPEGTCWEDFTQEQCWQDCRALYNGYSSNCEDEPKCCECTAPQDCEYSPDYDACIDNKCGVEIELSGCESLYDQCDITESPSGPEVFSFYCELPNCPDAVESFLACVFENYMNPCETTDCIWTPDDFCWTLDPCTAEAAEIMECIEI